MQCGGARSVVRASNAASVRPKAGTRSIYRALAGTRRSEYVISDRILRPVPAYARTRLGNGGLRARSVQLGSLRPDYTVQAHLSSQPGPAG